MRTVSPLRWGFRLLSPGGSRGRLSILILHRVHARPDPLFPGEMDAQRFRILLGWLRQWFQVLPLDQALQRLQQGGLPARAAAISFDDGYADNHQVALPLLEQAGLTACFFIASGFLDGGRMWNDVLIEAVRGAPGERLDLRDLAPSFADLAPLDLGNWEARSRAAQQLIERAKYLPMAERQALVESVARASGAPRGDDLMMSSAQLRDLRRRGMVVGAHTVNHPILARLPAAQAADEIERGKAALEALLDERVGLFAYPNGKPGEDYLPEHVDLVRAAGFDAAVTTSPGAAGPGSDRFQIPRFTPWQSDRLRVGLSLMRNLR